MSKDMDLNMNIKNPSETNRKNICFRTFISNLLLYETKLYVSSIFFFGIIFIESEFFYAIIFNEWMK